jgi:hypothetical protein
MAARIKTTGELREFLVNMMLGVKNGEVKIDEAARITKLAAQIHESFYSEIKIAKVQIESGQQTAALGTLSINRE